MIESKEKQCTEGCTFQPEINPYEETRNMITNGRSLLNNSFNSYVGGKHRRRNGNEGNNMNNFALTNSTNNIHETLYDLAKKEPKIRKDRDKIDIEFE
jgi:hypothetical protein